VWPPQGRRHLNFHRVLLTAFCFSSIIVGRHPHTRYCSRSQVVRHILSTTLRRHIQLQMRVTISRHGPTRAQQIIGRT
jgi:hypothetical protein